MMLAAKKKRSTPRKTAQGIPAAHQLGGGDHAVPVE
jgi:hypothetical protein